MITILLIKPDKELEERFRDACKRNKKFDVVAFTDTSGLDTVQLYLMRCKTWVLAYNTEENLNFLENLVGKTTFIQTGFVIVYWKGLDGYFANCETVPNSKFYPIIYELTEEFCMTL